jgi:peptidoglycan/LPS O-acetylase OafA/YrhL
VAVLKRAPQFPLLDSVRAIAALSVVALHAFVWAGATREATTAAPWVARLDVGVTIFFLLSGFLLYRPFVRARLLGERSPHAAAYGWRRVLRIVPAYWVALTVSALWLGHHGVFDPPAAWSYYGFAQIYTGHVLGGLSQAWTLCVELTFYALLPAWAWLMRRFDRDGAGSVRSELVALALLAAIGTVYQVVLLATAADATHANTAAALTFLPGYLDHFALGMAIAVASVVAEARGRAPRAVAWAERRPWLAWGLALAAFAVVCRGIGLSGVGILAEPYTAWQALGRHWLYAVVALGVLLPAVFGDPRTGLIRRRVLGNPVLLWVGVVSYGVYLWHDAVFEQAVSWGWLDAGPHPYVTMLAAGVSGALLLAALSFYVLERPLLRLKRLVPDAQAPPRDPRTHAPMESTPVSVRA